MTDSNEVMPQEKSLRVYEVGYLLLPSIPEEKLPEETTRLKSLIAQLGGEVISEEDPQARPLSYEMVKQVGTKNERFTNAYFGWVKFESMPEVAVELKKKLDLDQSFLRFLIVKTVRENVLAAAKKEREDALRAEEGDAEEGNIDQKIDELVSE